MKRCPYCARGILEESVECKYCGKHVVDEQGVAVIEKKSPIAYQLTFLTMLVIALFSVLVSGNQKEGKSSAQTKVGGYQKSDSYSGYKGRTYRKSESSGLVNWGSVGQSDQEAADVLNDYFDSR